MDPSLQATMGLMELTGRAGRAAAPRTGALDRLHDRHVYAAQSLLAALWQARADRRRAPTSTARC